jgi:hypothetical protein
VVFTFALWVCSRLGWTEGRAAAGLLAGGLWERSWVVLVLSAVEFGRCWVSVRAGSGLVWRGGEIAVFRRGGCLGLWLLALVAGLSGRRGGCGDEFLGGFSAAFSLLVASLCRCKFVTV